MDTWITWAGDSQDMALHPQLRSLYQNAGQDVVICLSNSRRDIYHILSSSEGDNLDIELTALPEASGDDYYTVLSTQWIDYIDGVLQNIGYTEYVAYCLRDYSSMSSYTYVDKYVLVYDLTIDEQENVVVGEYPYMMIYRASGASTYTVEEGYTSEVYIPSPAYGSFGTLSELREGGGIIETYTILFAIGFAVCCYFIGAVFKHVFPRKN